MARKVGEELSLGSQEALGEMIVLNTVRDEFNISLESFLEELLRLQYQITNLFTRVDVALPQPIVSEIAEMTVTEELTAGHFVELMDIVRMSPSVRTAIMFVLQSCLREKLSIISGSGFYCRGNKTVGGVCFKELRRDVRHVVGGPVR